MKKKAFIWNNKWWENSSTFFLIASYFIFIEYLRIRKQNLETRKIECENKNNEEKFIRPLRKFVFKAEHYFWLGSLSWFDRPSEFCQKVTCDRSLVNIWIFEKQG